MFQFRKILFYLFIITLFLINANVFSQVEVSLHITKALAVKPSDFANRSVNQKNIFEYILITDQFNSPEVGTKISELDSANSIWKEITENESGWFQDESLKGGYAYLEINSKEEKTILMKGSAYSLVYVNKEPRAGNVYQYKDKWESWEPDFGFSYLPVKLKKGKNEFIFKCYYGKFKVRFFEISNLAQFNINDITMPDVQVDERIEHFGGIIIINNSKETLKNLAIVTEGENLTKVETMVPTIQPVSTRKVKIDFKGKAVKEKTNKEITITLINKLDNSILDSNTIQLRILNRDETYKQTFVSNIDESVQYYAVNPTLGNNDSKALFFSLHGAAVHAENQANSYYSKDWGIIVSPTNRRPHGFNWEDWGRWDALEVFDIALNKFNIDPSRIYLTGHSMGGHGTWHMGSTFPDRFAAIGPSAGWISFWSYRFNDKYSEGDKVIDLINRTGNPSNTYAMAENFNQHGVYIIHGADDDNVRASQSHSIIKELEKSHKDYIYHEEPNAGHWWDKSDERGADCVDWAPMFDFFARHARPEKNRTLNVKFITASPGVSEKNNWVTIYRQEKYLEYSSVDLKLDPGIQRISGSTKNISILGFDVGILDRERNLTVILDDQIIDEIKISNLNEKIWFNKIDQTWKFSSTPNPVEKGPKRYGTFKDAFRNNVVFVYGTIGSKEENDWSFTKARYDAEHFWYQGNGAIEIIADYDYFTDKYKNRNIILYGNSETNSAWNNLLSDSPVQVNRESIIIGDKKYYANDLSCLFIRPKKDEDESTVGVVSGTGLVGLKLNNSIPFMSPGFTYPDVTVFSSSLLKDENGYIAAGFYGYDWSVQNGEFVFNE